MPLAPRCGTTSRQAKVIPLAIAGQRRRRNSPAVTPEENRDVSLRAQRIAPTIKEFSDTSNCSACIYFEIEIVATHRMRREPSNYHYFSWTDRKIHVLTQAFAEHIHLYHNVTNANCEVSDAG
jgi:hypothetical protein